MNNEKKVVVVVGIALACLCGICLVLAISSGLLYKFTGTLLSEAKSPIQPTLTLPPTSTVIPSPSAKPAQVQAGVLLRSLQSVDIPTSDLIVIAERFSSLSGISPTVPQPAKLPQVGDEQNFWIQNSDTNTTVSVTADLVYLNEHAYLWVQKGFEFDEPAMKQILDTFSKDIYPKDRSFFGSEWNPGVDGDPRLYILWTSQVGSGVAGSFSSTDEYPQQVQHYSNSHEMFLMNTDILLYGQRYVDGVLAHEFQHMIHWNQDRNEDAWLNEGFSELASLLTGYFDGGFVSQYMDQTDVSLDDWSLDQKANLAHYGASFSFLSYFYDRFGREVTQAVVADPLNGLASIDDTLQKQNIKDPQSGAPITADDVFADWVVTSYLQNGKVGDGRYTFKAYSNGPKPKPTEKVSTCPMDDQTRTVNQYGVDYIDITCKGNYQLIIRGQQLVNLLPQAPHSGNYAFWSNKGDESDMRLLKTFDFSNVTGSLTFNYWTWFNIENGYDYAYLVASDDGKKWQILKTPSGTISNPNGNSYGWAYTGNSNGWIRETADLSQFAGKKIQLGFEYVTDAETYGEGFLVDDLDIPQIGYQEDFEQGDGGWQGEGFIRVSNLLPQTFRISLIKYGSTIAVQTVQLDQDNQVSIPISIGDNLQEVVVVVSGTTRYTRQPAFYQYSIQNR